jgi:DNA-binding beta-propeller fold protein YncE
MRHGARSGSARPTAGWVIWFACVACLVVLFVVPGRALGFGPISTFGSAGTAAGQLSQPQGLAVGPEGYVYLANAGNSRVDVFTATGAYVRSLGKAPVPVPGDGCEGDENVCDDGTGQAGVLRFPRDVAVDPAGNVFVANTGNQRIDVFSPAGAFLRAFGEDVNPSGGDVCTEATQCKRGTGGTAVGAISSPNGIALDSTGLVYIAGSNYRIDVFTPAGAYVRRIGKELTSSGECRDDENCTGNTESELAGAMKPAQDVGIDASGRVAVADAQNFRIDVFTSTGTFLHAFGKGVSPAGGDVCTAATGCKKGTESSSAGGLAFADALAVASSGNLYVADSRNHRVNEFRFDGTFVRAFGEGVMSGGTTFEVCTMASGCKAGRASTNVGSVAEVRGTALDCTGAVYAVESMPGQDGENTDAPTTFRVERFGEPGTGYPPCGSAAAPASTSAVLLTDAPLGPARGRPSTAKPSIKVELNSGSGTASLVVIVSDPGALLLKGKGIRTVKKKVKRPGLVELLVTTKGALKSKLEETGKATVKLTLVFKADNGASNTQTKTIGLKMVGLF